MNGNNEVQDLIDLIKGYRRFLIELGMYFETIKDDKKYEGFADNWIDFVKSPEIGFSPSEANTLMKMSRMFGLLELNDLPSHNNMKLMVNKDVHMELLKDAQLLSTTDFKEKIKDDEIGTQERTYTYEIIKRCNETGNIKRVYDEELEEAKKSLT